MATTNNEVKEVFCSIPFKILAVEKKLFVNLLISYKLIFASGDLNLATLTLSVVPNLLQEHIFATYYMENFSC